MRLIDADALLRHSVEADRMGAMLVVGIGHIFSAPTVSPWVKTSDRLPERMKLLPCSVRVLISCAIGVVSAQYDFQDNVWVDNFNHKHSPWSKINVYDQSMQVTHWMPLPEPPGGEGEG